MSKICIYHDADLDGHCSGAIWKTANPDGELIGLDYGKEVPWKKLEGNDVTLVDFSLQPWSDMQRLAKLARSLTWIDHHKSAIENYKTLSFKDHPVCVVLDSTKAACELTWEFYCPEDQMPRGVFLLGDYDCWRHSDEDTMPYQMGMRLYDMDPICDAAVRRWEKVFRGSEDFHRDTLQAGHTILEYQNQQNSKVSKAFWFPVDFDGKKWMAINRGMVNSKLWDSIWDDSFDGMLAFVRWPNHWTVSMYQPANGKVDCSEIAKRHGGGGHPGAAGFQCQTLPFSI